MNIYSIFGTDDPKTMTSIVEQMFDKKYRLLLNTEDWLVASEMTSTEIAGEIRARADEQEVDDEPVFLISPVTGSISGYHYTEIWDWIKSRRKMQ